MSFHLYQVNELYSNPDGSIQFIKMKVGNFSGEGFWQGVTLSDTQGGATHSFTFPTNLPSTTATNNTSVLIATQGFANLGIVTPDFIVPSGFLFTNGGTINYGTTGYYGLTADTVSYSALPTDGTHSIDRNGTSEVNSPTNFAGATGTVPVSVGAAMTVHGGPGDNTFVSGHGNDTFIGGTGTNTAVYSGSKSTYTITKNADGSFTVADSRGTSGDGTDTLTSVQSLRFADQTVKLVKLTDSASNSSDILGAYFSMFGRAPEPSGFQFWQGQLGTTYPSLGRMIDNWLTLSIVKANGYPDGQTIDNFIASIYQNVFNKAPDDGGYWKGQSASMSRGELVAAILAAANGVPAGTAGKDFVNNKIAASTQLVNIQYAYGKDMSLTDLTNTLKEVNANHATIQTADNDLVHMLGMSYGVAGLVGATAFTDTWLI